VPRQKILRLILANEASVTWSADNWATTNNRETSLNGALNLWFVDFATENLRTGTVLEFTFFWKKTLQWEGRNFAVTVE